jgi:hypothetical protein
MPRAMGTDGAAFALQLYGEELTCFAEPFGASKAI